jgi:hypothetical protein
VALNPNKLMDVSRLREAIHASRRKLEPFRVRHKQALEQYVGVYYSDDGATKPVHVNLMELATNIYERQLVARPPQVLIFTKNEQFKPYSLEYESLLNESLDDGKIHKIFQRSIKAALFSMGIVKVGIEDAGLVEEAGVEFSTTRPYVSNILLDDWVHDMSARSPDEISYCGHRYLMDLDEAKKFKGFSQSVRKELVARRTDGYNESGDERVNTLASGAGGTDAEIHDKVELWEIFLTKERLVVTIGPNEGMKPLRVVEWEGPDNHLGPYHLLWFSEVPGNSMPLAPAMLWSGLHNIVNGLYRKLERQSQRAKVVGLTRGMDTGDAERIRKAGDGEVVAVDNPDSVVEKQFGGIDQRNFAFMLQSKQMFSWLAGNLDALGGLAASSETVGQDKMLNASANQRVSGMQDLVMEFTRDILKSYGYWLWEDPVQTYDVELTFPDLPSVTSQLTPEEREAHSVYEHEVRIEPYSMQYLSPGQRLQSINQIVQGIIIPSLPLLQQQGMGLDMEALLEVYAKYANLPELRDIIINTGAPAQGGGEEPRQSPVTSRQTERISRAGAATPGRNEQEMIQQMMSGSEQQMQGA